jgi:hypothetical protein
MTDTDLEEIRKLLDAAESKIRQAKSKIFANEINKKVVMIDSESDDDSMHGFFDGEQMIGTDKKKYSVPPNYASKSKLVVGDKLKLSVSEEGKFLFKQIGPVERKNLIGTLEMLEDGNWQVNVNGKIYKVLLASVTYYKGKHNDQVSVVVPADQESEWATLDNVL